MNAPGPRFSRSLVCAALLLGVTASLAFWWWTPQRSSAWLARRTAERLWGGTNDEVVIAAGQLRAMGEPGWSELVGALDAERLETRSAAIQALSEQVAQWRGWPADMSVPQVAGLAKLVMDQLPDPDALPVRSRVRNQGASSERRTTLSGTLEPAEGVVFRAELAQQFLAWPGDGSSRLDLVYACERTIKWAREAGWPKNPLPEPPPDLPPEVAELVLPKAAPAARTPPALVPDARPLVPPLESAPMEGDGAESDLAATPRRVLPLEVFAADERQGGIEARPLLKQPAPPPPFELPDFLFVPPSRRVEESATSPGDMNGGRSLTPPAMGEETLSEPTPLLPSWPELEWTELIAAMRQSDLRAAGEQELRRRGANELNVRVARAVVSESVDERLRLVHMLPELSGVDSVGWLLLLARDPAPRVRAAAVRLLATGAEPRIRRELEALEETEENADVLLALRAARR